MSAQHDGARGDVRKARAEARAPEDAAVINGHRVDYRAHRYECLNCGTRLISVMQFQSRECRPRPVEQPTAAAPAATSDSLADWLGAMPESRNVVDITDEATTVITIDVETLAERIAAMVANNKARALGDTADELWRVFLRLHRTPSPVGDYVHGRVLAFREAAARVKSEAGR